MSARRPGALVRVVGADLDADEILRTTVAALAAEPGVIWAGISLHDEGELAPGPSAGMPDEGRRTSVPIVCRGAVVGELAADGATDIALLERIATLISAYVLAGSDTRGETWDP